MDEGFGPPNSGFQLGWINVRKPSHIAMLGRVTGGSVVEVTTGDRHSRRTRRCRRTSSRDIRPLRPFRCTSTDGKQAADMQAILRTVPAGQRAHAQTGCATGFTACDFSDPPGCRQTAVRPSRVQAGESAHVAAVHLAPRDEAARDPKKCGTGETRVLSARFSLLSTRRKAAVRPLDKSAQALVSLGPILRPTTQDGDLGFAGAKILRIALFAIR